MHDKYARLVAFFESTPAVRNVTISNLGRLDLPQQYRTIRLEKVYSPLVMVSPTPANTVVVSSFAGEMEFAIVSDEHSLPHAQALEIRQRAMEILRTCAAMPAHHESAVGNAAICNASGDDMKSFGLIFVLYQPSGDFLNNLVKARAACPNVVAVDNSTGADLRLHEHLREQGIEVIFNRNESGLAGAYNKGAEVLLGRQCDLIFLLDQDSGIEAEFFDGMMQAATALGADTFLLGPKIYEIQLQRCMPVIPPGKRSPRPVRIDDQTAGLFPTLCIISSGSAISAAAYRKLGSFREDYFIEYVDVEYSLRARSLNVPVYMNAAVTLRQTNGRIERHGKMFTTNHAAWRRYYIARNMVHCLHRYRSFCGLHWLSGLMAIQQAMLVLLFDSQKLRKLTAIACGHLDGMFGRLGPFERRHPHIAAFCKGTGRKEPGSRASSPAMAAEGKS